MARDVSVLRWLFGRRGGDDQPPRMEIASEADVAIAATRSGLSKHASTLQSLTRPALDLQVDTSANGAELGCSRLGGRPDLPAGFAWPSYRGAPIAFIAQVNLADVPKLDDPSPLPSSGLLSFWYAAVDGAWGFSPEDRGSFQVHHFPAEELETVRPPDDLREEARFDAVGVRFERVLTLPPWESSTVEALGLTDQELDAYTDLTDMLAPHDWSSRTLLLGCPDQIQADMQAECALVTGGLYCGDASGGEDPRAAGLLKTARSWRLLLQVASVEEIGTCWGDVGCLYYWMTEDALRRRAFNEAWGILQCT